MERTHTLELTSDQLSKLRKLIGFADESARDAFELSRRLCTEGGCEDDSPCQDCGSVSQDVTDAEEMDEILAELQHGDTADHGLPCGHSACRQNWIDTGETCCIEDFEPEQDGSSK